VLPRKRYPRAPICLRANGVFSKPFIPVCNPSLDDNKRGVYPCFPICHVAFSPNVFMMVFVYAAKLLVLPSAKTKIRHAFETRVFVMSNQSSTLISSLRQASNHYTKPAGWSDCFSMQYWWVKRNTKAWLVELSHPWWYQARATKPPPTLHFLSCQFPLFAGAQWSLDNIELSPSKHDDNGAGWIEGDQGQAYANGLTFKLHGDNAGADLREKDILKLGFDDPKRSTQCFQVARTRTEKWYLICKAKFCRKCFAYNRSTMIWKNRIT